MQGGVEQDRDPTAALVVRTEAALAVSGFDESLRTGEDVDFVLVIGGDGTFLTGARVAARLQLPVIGLGFGRLGFLASAELDELAMAGAPPEYVQPTCRPSPPPASGAPVAQAPGLRARIR